MSCFCVVISWFFECFVVYKNDLFLGFGVSQIVSTNSNSRIKYQQFMHDKEIIYPQM